MQWILLISLQITSRRDWSLQSSLSQRMTTTTHLFSKRHLCKKSFLYFFFFDKNLFRFIYLKYWCFFPFIHFWIWYSNRCVVKILFVFRQTFLVDWITLDLSLLFKRFHQTFMFSILKHWRYFFIQCSIIFFFYPLESKWNYLKRK